jgi:hypothetical protein
MDWLTFIAEMTKSLAWPLLLGTFLIALRKEVASLISDLRHLKYKDLEADFGKQIESMTVEADKAGLPPAPKQISGKSETEYLLPEDRFLRLAEVAPRAAIMEAWLDVESALRELAKRHNKPVDEHPYNIARSFFQLGVLFRSDIKLFDELRSLRNSVVHHSAVEVSKENAIEYRDVAVRFIEEIKTR